MLKRIKDIIRNVLERWPLMEKAYINMALFCCEHGIVPPLSGNPEKVESAWREQYPGSDDRDPCAYLEQDDQMHLMFLDILAFLEKEANILEIGCSAGRQLRCRRPGGAADSFLGYS